MIFPECIPPEPEETTTPVIEYRVDGPNRKPGLLLRAERLETLIWDLENEVASASRRWLDEPNAWWVSTSYLQTVLHLVLRSFPTVLVTGLGEHDRLFARDGRTMLRERQPTGAQRSPRGPLFATERPADRDQIR